MASSKKLQAVVIRAYSGVFFGYLKSKGGGGEHFHIELVGMRHVWQWKSEGLPRKAITIEDLACIGAGTGTRISGRTNGSIADVKVIAEASAESVARFEALPCL